ncbi:TetR/AcrR family transcriptional regulator C-terminal domain-containing protein [Streptomyces sp. NPDC001100]
MALWLNAKIHTHPDRFEELIGTHLAALVVQFPDAPERWFVRYRAPHDLDHLRLRIRTRSRGQAPARARRWRKSAAERDADPERRQEEVREYALEGRRRLPAHRDIARISMAHVPFTAEHLPHVEVLLGVFRTAGLPDRIAAEASDLVSTYIDGFVLEEGMGWDRAAQPECGTSSPAPTGVRWPAMVTDSSDVRFDIGLEIILRGLASSLPADPA